MLYSNTSYRARIVYYNWDLGKYGTEWYEPKHGKYLTWLTDEDGYIISDGSLISAEYHLVDKRGNLYRYDLNADVAIPIDGTVLFNHSGKPINGFKEDCAEYMEIQQPKKEGDRKSATNHCHIAAADLGYHIGGDSKNKRRLKSRFLFVHF